MASAEVFAGALEISGPPEIGGWPKDSGMGGYCVIDQFIQWAKRSLRLPPSAALDMIIESTGRRRGCLCGAQGHRMLKESATDEHSAGEAATNVHELVI